MFKTDEYINLFKYNLAIQKTTNELTAYNYKSEKHLGHLKDLEITKYKRESKGHVLIQICSLFFVNGCLIWLSKY